uniref:Uncharacterized protein n=1 Tax=Melanopsichium pennsylvanicum 4 TaxID=1398559 RepID=A0A077R7Q2_9BASI|nr:uncharacterized protein BN887_06190 [Melanopsichium pennsylvanicum 4]
MESLTVVWKLPEQSLIDEAVFPDEAYLWNDREEGSSIRTEDGVQKMRGGPKASGANSSFDGMDVDNCLSK